MMKMKDIFEELTFKEPPETSLSHSELFLGFMIAFPPFKTAIEIMQSN